ncbi:MAG TPA: LptF/LptG family permease [Myxococcota bacterium]|nr:LptF/LptG family permease [Myxococcota bacterium]HRY96159.1 LptF/LptG family permease [Myxococcota bacterium]
MRLHAYILRQVLGPCLGALVALNLILLVLELVQAGEVTFGAALGLGDLLSLAALGLPALAVLTVPVALLTGVLLGLGRMAEDHELAALAAAGVPLPRVAVAPVCLGLLAALGCLGLAGWAAPAAHQRLHTSLVELAKRQVVAALVPGRFFEEIPRVVLYPGRPGPDAGSFQDFLLFDHRPGRVRQLLMARRAVVAPMPGSNALELQLEDGEVHVRGAGQDYSVARFERASVGLDIDRLVYDRTRRLSPLERLDLGALEAAAAEPARPALERRRLRAAWHRRLAFPAAAVLFAGLGVALVGAGRLRGRRRTLLAAVAVVTAYYLLMRLGDTLVDRDALPGWLAAWAPALGLAGLVAAWSAWASRRPA